VDTPDLNTSGAESYVETGTVKPSTPYDKWKLEPTEDNMVDVIRDITPTINHVLTSIGSGGDKHLRSKARALAAGAIQTYDPTKGAQLHTWVSRQLLPLRRARRFSDTAAHVPEGIQLDAMTLMQAEQKFIDEHDREPDLLELADASRMPVTRIATIRKSFRPIPAEGAFTNETGDTNIPGSTGPAYSDEAMDYVYRDADYIDRKILEMKTGYGGSEILSPKDAAARLHLTPTQLSRRSAKIALQIQEIESALQQV
jgi:DNA-directed RNA polymerase specialized sigma subunit